MSASIFNFLDAYQDRIHFRNILHLMDYPFHFRFYRRCVLHHQQIYRLYKIFSGTHFVEELIDIAKVGVVYISKTSSLSSSTLACLLLPLRTVPSLTLAFFFSARLPFFFFVYRRGNFPVFVNKPCRLFCCDGMKNVKPAKRIINNI